ncbi:MAG: zinc ribbon domain-containing protein [Deltaproteobacteria bacterium]|jgi:hypothetical protein|nr:zinc ribbon domain-containing protein [Deltaproteobacteria bacterium]
MPVYEYVHSPTNPEESPKESPEESPGCLKVPTFLWEQPVRDLPLTVCPWCGKPVERVLSAPLVKKKNLDAELRDKGFTKLVRVDDGIFENVTRRNGETKYVDRRNPDTFPKLEKTIKD